MWGFLFFGLLFAAFEHGHYRTARTFGYVGVDLDGGLLVEQAQIELFRVDSFMKLHSLQAQVTSSAGAA